MKPVVSICIRTYSGTYNGKGYNRLSFLERNMRSLVKNTKIPHEVIVIDDASPQADQISYLKRIKKQGIIDQLIIKPRNLGRQHSFAMQRRLGLKSGAPFIYICDDDYEYVDEWLGTLVDAYTTLQNHWTKSPVGLLSGFNREGASYNPTFKLGKYKFGMSNTWLGCRWLMSREVLKNGGWLSLAPTKNWPKKWTSPWIDDGSYQLGLTSQFGYENALTLIEVPSVVDHIGTLGVHAPNIISRGAK